MARRARKSRADNQRWNQMIASLRLMNFAFNNIKLYPPTHSEVVGVVTKLHETLHPILEEQEDVGYGFMDELLYIEGAMSIEETAGNQMLVDRFNRCRVKYLTVMKGVTVEEFVKFFSILNAEALKPSTEHPSQLLEKQGITTIHIVEAEVDDVSSKSKTAKKKTLFDWYEKALATLAVAQEGLKASPEPDLQPLYRVVDDLMATVRNKGFEPFLLLPHLSRGMDPHLAHNVNVAILCCAMGDLYGLNSGQINSLCATAFLHDLGRLTIPVEWTEDHSPLQAAERAIAREHSDWGFLLLLRNPETPPQMAIISDRHHDPAKGGKATGYAPDVFHKILSVADAYDLAMVSERYYWKKRRADRILARMLNRRGELFEPLFVKLLINCVGYYPVGSLVRLDDGRRGIVVRPNAGNVARPRLYMFDEAPPPPPPASAEGAPEAAAALPLAQAAVGIPEEPPPVILDLADFNEAKTGFKRRIVGVLDFPPDVDPYRLIDRKKEYLLSYTL